MPNPTHAQETHPLASGMDHALDGDMQGPVKQLRRPGDNGPAMQSAANTSPQVKQLRASEAAANTAVIQRKQASETGLPDGLKTGIESLSGFSLDHVKVIYNSSKPAQLHAHAYACGDEIHVAPGQEQHLPEEAWHIVQQMRGQVQQNTAIAGQAVNNEKKLEDEARDMGAKAMALEAAASAQPRQQAQSAAPPVHQLKSKFETPMDSSSAPTPLASLSKAIKPYYDKTDLPELYTFHGGKQVSPDAYKDNYLRAKSATAILEDGPKAGKRDNTVIGPYGHFGWMERSILGRPNYGNIFDGGHLIERSLMEGADADIEGNLAPQEGKTFNQNLMRGWEHIPEEYRHLMSFKYKMELAYTEDTYTRTGKELIEAGVVPDQLAKSLDSTEKVNLEKEVVPFVRWIPYKWSGTIDAGEGKTFKEKLFNYGKHQHGLQNTPQDAESSVLKKEEETGLKRTNSGIIRGAISDLKKTESGNQFKVGGKQTISSEMFAGVPQPQQEVGKRGELKPQDLSSEKLVVAMLKQPFSFKALAEELKNCSPKKKKKPKQNKEDATIDKEAKDLSSSYKFLRENNFFDQKAGAGFVTRLYNEVLSDENFVLTKVSFLKLATGGLVSEQNKRRLLTMDEQCYDGEIPEEKEEEEEDLEQEKSLEFLKDKDEKEVEEFVEVLDLEDEKEFASFLEKEKMQGEEKKTILDQGPLFHFGPIQEEDDHGGPMKMSTSNGEIDWNAIFSPEQKKKDIMHEEEPNEDLSSSSEETLLGKRTALPPLYSFDEEVQDKIVDENEEAEEEEVDPFADNQLKKKKKTEGNPFDFPGFDPSTMNFTFDQQQ